MEGVVEMARSDSGTELLKGTIPLMALRVIGEGDCYGYDLIKRIEAASQDYFRKPSASLAPSEATRSRLRFSVRRKPSVHSNRSPGAP